LAEILALRHGRCSPAALASATTKTLIARRGRRIRKKTKRNGFLDKGSRRGHHRRSKGRSKTMPATKFAGKNVNGDEFPAKEE
jgi:hypothetical protein